MNKIPGKGDFDAENKLFRWKHDKNIALRIAQKLTTDNLKSVSFWGP